ncbi:hypothetical protein D7Z54_25495, partial [Salibacterium salarium]
MLNEKTLNHKTDRSIILHTLVNYEQRLRDYTKQLQSLKQGIAGFKEKEDWLKGMAEEKKQSIDEQKDMNHLFQNIVDTMTFLKENKDIKENEISEKKNTINQYKKQQKQLQQKLEAFRRENKSYKRNETSLKGEIQTKNYILQLHDDSKKKVIKTIQAKNNQIKHYKNVEQEQQEQKKRMIQERNDEKMYLNKVILECEEVRQHMSDRKIHLYRVENEITQAIGQLQDIEDNV